MMMPQLMALRIWTLLLVGMRPVPALQIPTHLPGSCDPTDHQLMAPRIWKGGRLALWQVPPYFLVARN